jgi:WD40 repeat protein
MMPSRIWQWIVPVLLVACAPSTEVAPPVPPPAPEATAEPLVPVLSWQSCDRLALGAPVAICVDFGGGVVVADASPARLVSYRESTHSCQEFQQPDGMPGFRPSDVSIRGFFVYAIDETDRMLLRWDSSGSYRDVLVNFSDLDAGRRVSPCGLDVDASSGRLAITDVENHRIFVLDTYLRVDVAFGNYGSFDGQLDTPQGVSFMPDGHLLVADSGNGRLQVFTDAGAHVRTIPASGVENPMRRPRRAVATQDGTVYVADPVARRVFMISPDGRTFRAFVPDGAKEFEPTDVAFGKDGRVYVTDSATKTLYAFKVM